ncbi:hypothetical protein O9929_13660 [Vibrio lentus]|nr:hypothetical protein [Vibrio lentus]
MALGGITVATPAQAEIKSYGRCKTHHHRQLTNCGQTNMAIIEQLIREFDVSISLLWIHQTQQSLTNISPIQSRR